MGGKKGVSKKRTVTRNGNEGIRINSRKGKSTSRLTGRQIFLVLILLFLFMGSGISYVWSTFESTKIGYDISKLRRQEARLQEINSKLRAEIAFLKSPERLETKAAKDLGLQEPRPDQIVVLP